MDALTKLEHVPEELLDFFDWNTPNSLNLSDCYSIRGFHLMGKRAIPLSLQEESLKVSAMHR